jgi:hypothetical protein
VAATDLLIPPKRFNPERGQFRWPAAPVLAGPAPETKVPLGQLAADLAAMGMRSRIARDALDQAAVRIRRDKSVEGGESYRLTIRASGVEIAASGDAGAYYAVQTLREMLAIHGRMAPACRIEDRPDFARRGVYLDCSRGKVPRLATLKALVERLARWKVNELQLYVENVFTWRRHPLIGRGYSPFTPDELLALQDHGRRHHVRLVGSLASFGHMEKILALPRYSRLGEWPGFRGLPGGTTLCPTDPGSIRLVEELYEEFVPLFEAEDFNACCDETWELGRGRSRRRAERIGPGRLYFDFLRKIHRLCRRYGKRMNVWADIVLEHPEMLGDLPTDMVMLNWDYDPDGQRIGRTREIVDAGLAAMVCPGTNAWNSHGCRLKAGMQNIARFAAEGVRCGAEGLLNTDWGDNGHRNMLAVSLHNYAYGAAHAWNHRGTREAGFTERFCRHTFGAEGRGMAESIRVLGSAHETLGLPYANSTVLYAAFLGPTRRFLGQESPEARALDAVRPADLARHVAALADLRWPKPSREADRLLRTALEEYPLAARLDRVACRRTALLKRLRGGLAAASAELRSLINLTEEVAGELRRVWLLGNKPSRLRDQLAGLRQVAAEYRRLLRR